MHDVGTRGLTHATVCRCTLGACPWLMVKPCVRALTHKSFSLALIQTQNNFIVPSYVGKNFLEFFSVQIITKISSPCIRLSSPPWPLSSPYPISSSLKNALLSTLSFSSVVWHHLHSCLCSPSKASSWSILLCIYFHSPHVVHFLVKRPNLYSLKLISPGHFPPASQVY